MHSELHEARNGNSMGIEVVSRYMSQFFQQFNWGTERTMSMQ